jgi:hypothetical protein
MFEVNAVRLWCLLLHVKPFDFEGGWEACIADNISLLDWRRLVFAEPWCAVCFVSGFYSARSDDDVLHLYHSVSAFRPSFSVQTYRN